MLPLSHRILPAKAFEGTEVNEASETEQEAPGCWLLQVPRLALELHFKGNNGDLDGAFDSIHPDLKGGERGKARQQPHTRRKRRPASALT